MKRFGLFTGFALMAALAGPVFAASKTAAVKSPADLAAEAFFKLHGDKEAKPNPARFQKLIASGVGFITQNPTDNRAPEVIVALANFGSTMKDKSLAAERASWLASLKVEIINQRHNDKLSEDARAAVAALEAEAAGTTARDDYNRDNVTTFREKIDELAAKPGGERFIAGAESSYVDLLLRTKPALAEEHLNKLLAHPNPKVVAMAKDEINMIAAHKTPFDLKFTALDGRAVDFSQLRGKFVLLTFWSTTSKGSVEDQRILRELYAQYKKGFEVIGVVCDKEENRAAVVKFVKDNKLSWPHYFDGKQFDNEFAPKLNVRVVPKAILFGPNGIPVMTDVRINKLEPDLKKALGIKDPPKERPAIKTPKPKY